MSHQKSHDLLAAKRSQFTSAGGVNPKLVITSVAVVALVLIGTVAFSNRTTSAAFSSADGAEIRIPLSEISSGDAKFYDYQTAKKKNVRFFVLRSADGIYRAAADTCDVCYRAKMGYFQDGDAMVCRKCNQRFPSNSVNEVRGGCNPAGVPNRVEGDSLVIQTAQLEANAHYF